MIPLNKPKEIIRLLVFLFLGFPIAVFLMSYAFDYFDSDYVVIEKESAIEGIVSSSKPYQSVAYIKINNVDYKLLSARNYKYDPYDLNYFLKEGDYLLKTSNSDTLTIKRNREEYVFVIGGYLNKELRKD